MTSHLERRVSETVISDILSSYSPDERGVESKDITESVQKSSYVNLLNLLFVAYNAASDKTEFMETLGYCIDCLKLPPTFFILFVNKINGRQETINDLSAGLFRQ